MFNLVKTSCFVDRRCDRVLAQKDVVSFEWKNCPLLESGKAVRESDAVERSLRGVAPQILGKDEVASSNLASSSKKSVIPTGMADFFQSSLNKYLQRDFCEVISNSE